MAVQTWDEIIRRGNQRAISTGRQGALGTGFTADELGALREAELAVGARNALAVRNQEESERNAAFNRDMATKQMEGQKTSQAYQLGTTLLGTYDKWSPMVKSGVDKVTSLFSTATPVAENVAPMAADVATSSMATVGANTATEAAITTSAMDAGIGAPVGMSTAELAGETAAGTSSGMSTAAGGIAAIAALSIIAADKAGRERGGSVGLTQGTPFSLVTAPQSMLADKVFGDSNYFTKNLNAMQRQERGFYGGLNKLMSGDVEGWARESANALLTPITAIFGLDDIF